MQEYFKLKLLDNKDYEDCLTVGKIYTVEIEDNVFYKIYDDKNEPLTTMWWRWEKL